MTRIGIFGSDGRMGLAIAKAIPASGAALAGGADQGDDAQAIAARSDVLVDFSHPAALAEHLTAAKGVGVPILIGTTGLKAQHHAEIENAAQHIAVLQTGNTSLGVTLLAALVQEAAAKLGSDWDIEIVEMHHRHKLDAPSGTALLLGEAAAAGRGVAPADSFVEGRAGLSSARAEDTIGFASLRGGSVLGDHTVILAAEGERIELSHRAEDRAIFAHGAVKAALWLAGQQPGRYTMREVLGL